MRENNRQRCNQWGQSIFLFFLIIQANSFVGLYWVVVNLFSLGLRLSMEPVLGMGPLTSMRQQDVRAGRKWNCLSVQHLTPQHLYFSWLPSCSLPSAFSHSGASLASVHMSDVTSEKRLPNPPFLSIWQVGRFLLSNVRIQPSWPADQLHWSDMCKQVRRCCCQCFNWSPARGLEVLHLVRLALMQNVQI